MKIRKSISVILALVLCLGIAPVATANTFAGDDVSERFTDIRRGDGSVVCLTIVVKK